MVGRIIVGFLYFLGVSAALGEQRIGTNASSASDAIMGCDKVERNGPWRPSSSLSSSRSAHRIFVFAMQSSGASTFLFLLAQLPYSVAIVDLFVGRSAPPPWDLGLTKSVSCVFLKATVNTVIDVKRYFNTFKPTISILLLRHPAHNIRSLATKRYAHVHGDVRSKLVAQEKAFVERDDLNFTMTLLYEDLFLRPNRARKALIAKMGLTRAAADCMFSFRRSPQHVEAFTTHHCRWCGTTFQKLWGFGNLHTSAGSGSSSLLPSRSVLDASFVDKSPSEYERAMAAKFSPEISALYARAYPDLSLSSSPTLPSMLGSPTNPFQGQRQHLHQPQEEKIERREKRRRRRRTRDVTSADRIPSQWKASRFAVKASRESARLNERAVQRAQEMAAFTHSADSGTVLPTVATLHHWSPSREREKRRRNTRLLLETNTVRRLDVSCDKKECAFMSKTGASYDNKIPVGDSSRHHTYRSSISSSFSREGLRRRSHDVSVSKISSLVARCPIIPVPIHYRYGAIVLRRGKDWRRHARAVRATKRDLEFFEEGSLDRVRRKHREQRQHMQQIRHKQLNLWKETVIATKNYLPPSSAGSSWNAKEDSRSDRPPIDIRLVNANFSSNGISDGSSYTRSNHDQVHRTYDGTVLAEFLRLSGDQYLAEDRALPNRDELQRLLRLLLNAGAKHSWNAARPTDLIVFRRDSQAEDLKDVKASRGDGIGQIRDTQRKEHDLSSKSFTNKKIKSGISEKAIGSQHNSGLHTIMEEIRSRGLHGIERIVIMGAIVEEVDWLEHLSGSIRVSAGSDKIINQERDAMATIDTQKSVASRERLRQLIQAISAAYPKVDLTVRASNASFGDADMFFAVSSSLRMQISKRQQAYEVEGNRGKNLTPLTTIVTDHRGGFGRVAVLLSSLLAAQKESFYETLSDQKQ